MRTVLAAVLALAVLLSFTACDEGTMPLPSAGNTPPYVLRSLIYAFNNRDIDTLDEALADDFTFHFDPNDVGHFIEDYAIPESWSRETFLEACGNVFEDAYSVGLDVGYESIGDPDSGATEFAATDVYIDLLVMVDAMNGFIGEGFCDFQFVNEGTESTDEWAITDWWDKTGYSVTEGLSSPASFGIILALFR